MLGALISGGITAGFVIRAMIAWMLFSAARESVDRKERLAAEERLAGGAAERAGVRKKKERAAVERQTAISKNERIAAEQRTRKAAAQSVGDQERNAIGEMLFQLMQGAGGPGGGSFGAAPPSPDAAGAMGQAAAGPQPPGPVDAQGLLGGALGGLDPMSVQEIIDRAVQPPRTATAATRRLGVIA